MDVETALKFLGRHQPLPDDTELDDELIRLFEAARSLFEDVVDDRCVELLLHSFGEGTGFGAYQMVEVALANQDPAVVAEALPRAIGSDVASVRSWAVEIAAAYPEAGVREAVRSALPRLDEDGQFWAEQVIGRTQEDET